MTDGEQSGTPRVDAGGLTIAIAAWGAAIVLIVAIAGAFALGARGAARLGSGADEAIGRLRDAFPPDLFDVSIDLPQVEDPSLTPGVWYPVHGDDAPSSSPDDPSADVDPTPDRNPSWLSRPKSEFPVAAQRAGIEAGSVVLTCRVRTDGLTSACRVETETPPGVGFGRATMAGMSDARLGVPIVDGRPVGGQVRFTTRYRLQ